MPAGFVGYNQASDVGNSFGGVGDILGSAILRGAMMRQQQAQRQQELMMEIARLRQEQENAQSLKEYRGEEIGLRKKEGEREDTKVGLMKQKADEGAAEMAVRKRFAGAARTEGMAPLKRFGDPSASAVKEYDEQKRQGDVNEGMAFLSNDPSKGMEGIARQNALRSVGDNPVINQMLATGQGLHNVPTGAIAVPPAGGDAVATGPARPSVGADASVNNIANLLARRLGLSTSVGEAMKDKDTALMNQFIMNAIRKQMGINAPPAAAEPLTAINPQTKQRIVSYDGGQTWQPAQ